MADVNPTDLTVRPAIAGDEDFLRRLHEDERKWEFEPLLHVGQDDLYHKLMKQQYESQQSEYFNEYDLAQYGIIQWTNIPIGRLYVDYRDHEVRILQIGLLKDYRGKGVANVIIQGLCVEAAMRRLPVRLTVNWLNKAKDLYLGLGFVPLGPPSHATEMEWFHPDPDAIFRGEFLPPRPSPESLN